MTRMEATVFIVDDDEAIRQSLILLMKSVGIKAFAYPSALEFLDAYDPTQPGCLVVDVRMPGMSGLDLQQHLANQRIAIPIIIITGHGEQTVVEVARNIDKEAVKRAESKISSNIIRQVMEGGTAVLTDSAMEDKELSSYTSVANLKLRSSSQKEPFWNRLSM